MSERTTVRLISAIITATAGVMMLASSAAAAPPPPHPTPFQCVDEFTINDNYVGDGWVGALVTTASGPAGDFSLFCVDELSSVVHVANPQSSGTVHPVFADTEDQFRNAGS